jgi:hypothetical protein
MNILARAFVAAGAAFFLIGAQEKAPLPKADAEGWISLFNGKDLTGWEGNPEVWKVEDGQILGKAPTVKGNTFLIYAHPFSDFTLEIDLKLVKIGKFPNSGIQYRSKVVDAKNWVVGGYQADIGDGWWGALYEERGRGVLKKPAADFPKTIKDGDWNHFVVTAKGTKLTQAVNGVTAIEFDDTDEAKRKSEGILALQYHAPGENFEIRAKNIRIKILK